jgi:hypothetical protein
MALHAMKTYRRDTEMHVLRRDNEQLDIHIHETDLERAEGIVDGSDMACHDEEDLQGGGWVMIAGQGIIYAMSPSHTKIRTRWRRLSGPN